MTAATKPTTGRPAPYVAVITGAASGMGLATTELFLSKGWTVIALDLHATSCDPACGTLIPLQTDITDRRAVARGLQDALGDTGPIQVVANIAGVFPPSTLETFSEELYRTTFDVNVLGTLNVVAETRPFLAKNSSVVNFSSVDAFAVSPGQLLYGASKAAVTMLTKELALELAPEGIRVNAIAPGWVDTPGNAATGRMAAAADSVPLKRIAQPNEIARWVEIISGEESGFLSGETIVLSGAAVMR